MIFQLVQWALALVVGLSVVAGLGYLAIATALSRSNYEANQKPDITEQNELENGNWEIIYSDGTRREIVVCPKEKTEAIREAREEL